VVESGPVSGLGEPANVLVTGASSGIGLALVRQLMQCKQVGRLFAVSRTASTAEALSGLRAECGDRMQCIDADITQEHDLARMASMLKNVDALHLVINAAGVLHGPGLAPEKAIEQVCKRSFEQVFALNAYAPLLLAQALMPLLCRNQPAVFASLSARVGSIGDNRAGGWYAYRASKSAQNQLLKTFSIEWKRRNSRGICLLLHPGTVDTSLSAPFQANVPFEKLFDPDLAARQLLTVIAHSAPVDSGRFLAWDGTDIPW
jgi:NAD(P)-dependent dehydrogenase (short-subunit alcohol dehydrogenase family)